MPATSACPPRDELHKLSQGQLPSPEVQRLAEHLEGCPACATIVQSLSGHDTLSEALKGVQAAARDTPRGEAVDRLIHKVIQLPAASMPIEATYTGQPQPAAPVSEATQEGIDFLAPAQGPGEMGRLGGYRVLKLLGSGGMGVVFHAEDERLQREVALKVMRPQLALKDTARLRFLREAQAMAKVKHDHVVTVYQVGEDRGAPFVAMEFLQGEPLDRWIDRGRRPSVAQTLRLAREIARGLAAAHGKGLIHRDIKPGNIWLEAPQGRVKILDFGLARATSGGEEMNLTQSGAIVGTPAYMAPEQARAEAVDARTDLFSLGVVLYRLTTGRLPFGGKDTMSMLMSLAMDTPKPVRELNPELPAELADLIMQLLEKDPGGRPESAKAVVDAVQAIERRLSNPAAAAPVAPVAAPVAPPAASAANPFADLTEVGPKLVVPPRLAPTQKPPASGRSPGLPIRPRSERETASPASTNRKKLLIGTAALGAAVVLAGVIIVIKTRSGETTIEVADKSKVKVDEQGRVIVEPPEGGPRPPVPGVPVLPAGASPFDALRREDIPADVLLEAGGGDAEKTPPELVAVYGERQPKLLMSQIAVAPDGQRIYAMGPKRNLFVWDTASGKARPEWNVDDPTTMSLSRDGSRLAVGHTQARQGVTVYDTKSGEDLPAIDAQKTGTVRALDLTPDGKRLAVAGGQPNANVAVVWDLQTRQELLKLEGHTSTISHVTYSPDGQRLATASADGTVKIWNASDGKELHSQSNQGKAGVRSLVFSPDGTRLTVKTTTVQVFDVASGGEVMKLTINDAGVAAYSPDGQWLATVFQSTGAIINLRATDPTGNRENRVLRVFPGPAGGIAFAPDGRHVLAGLSDGRVHVYRLAPPPSAESVKPPQSPVAGASPFDSFDPAKLPAAEIAALGVSDALKAKIVGLLGRDQFNGRHINGPVAISPNGKLLAICFRTSKNTDIKLWDVASWSELRTISVPEGSSDTSSSIAFSSDNQQVAFLTNDTLRFYDVATGQPARSLSVTTQGTHQFIFSPDGKSLASSALRTGQLVLLDLVTGKERVVHQEANVLPFDFQPDGQALLAGGLGLGKPFLIELADGKVRPVDASTGNKTGYRAGAFRPDGKVVALLASGRPNQLDFWQLDAGKQLESVPLGFPAASMAYAPDGRHLVITGTETGLFVLRLAPPEKDE